MTAWVEVIAAVLNGVCQGLVLTAAVWLLLRLVRMSAAARYAIWMIALAVVAALPVLNLAWPREAQAASAATAAGQMPAVALPAPGVWIVWVFAAWAAIAGVLLARLAASYAGLARLKRSAVKAPEAVERRYERLAGAGRRAVVQCAGIPVPVAAGLWKPAILLPSALAAELSVPELDQVLLHELAHVRRRDDWTNLAARLLEAVAFFHPAVWWIGRRLSIEREIACDDCVVRGTGAAVPYAACLVKLAQGSLARRGPRLAHAAVAGKREFTLRIEALLAATRAARSSRIAVLAVLAGLGAAAVAAPELGVFSVPLPALPPAAAAVRVASAPFAKPAVQVAVRRAPARPRRTEVARVRPARAVVVDTYYVLYLNETGPNLIQVLWLHPLPERWKLDGI